MKIIACVPVINRPDLLQAALRSLLAAVRSGLLSHIYAIDNSTHSLTRDLIAEAGELRRAAFDGRLIELPCPVALTFAQTQNYMQHLVEREGADAVLFAHSDMAATPEAVERVLAAARRDCVVFSHYDVLAAFGADVIRRVGSWDTAIPWYYADNDWYRRVRLAGLEVVEAGGEGVTHQNDASSTMKSDWRLALATNQQTQIARAVYIEKWGGPPERERFSVPYDGTRLVPPLEWLMSDPLYHALASSYETVEGTLFEQEPRGRWAQLRAIAWAYEQAGRPAHIVETGTAKGFFGYLLSWLVTEPNGAHLFTYDGDPRSATAVELLRTSQRTLASTLTLGDSKQTFRVGPGIGMAWIDGGHDEATAYSDITACLRANTPWVLVDDTQMPEVRRAVDQAVGEFPAYREVAHPWQADDARRIAVLARR